MMMFGMETSPAEEPVPIHYAALALETARLGGELADGLMLYLCTPERMRKSAEVAHEEARKRGRKPSDVTVTCWGPGFPLHDDLKRAVPLLSAGCHSTERCRFIIDYSHAVDSKRRGQNHGCGKAPPPGGDDRGGQRRDGRRARAGWTGSTLPRAAQQYRRAGAEVPIVVPNPVEEDYSTGVRRVLKAFAS